MKVLSRSCNLNKKVPAKNPDLTPTKHSWNIQMRLKPFLKMTLMDKDINLYEITFFIIFLLGADGKIIIESSELNQIKNESETKTLPKKVLLTL
jgi:hypothetical protein